MNPAASPGAQEQHVGVDRGGEQDLCRISVLGPGVDGGHRVGDQFLHSRLESTLSEVGELGRRWRGPRSGGRP